VSGSNSSRRKSPRGTQPDLSVYIAKRDAAKTPEPMGSKKTNRRGGATKPVFVIQEHHATALHWDFRLEHEGVLVSWALPKGLPTSTTANHLAVRTEDHPLDYQSFEGEIPEGEYGAGRVSIWDHGTYDPEKWRDDEVIVILRGKRSSGRFALFATGGKNWLIHRMDPPREDFLEIPTGVRPMLAAAGDLPSGTNEWAYEFKWDGVRAMVYVENGRVRALTRNDKNLVRTFPELRAIGLHLGSCSAVLDGEIVVLDDQGRPSFSMLSHRLHLTSKSEVARVAKKTPASFFAFDLLYFDGRSMVDLTYDERRAALEAIGLDGDGFATPPSVTNTSGADILAISRERGLEGVVAKRRRTRYSPGQRNGDWVKIKNFRSQEVVVGGWTEGRGALTGTLGALLLGVPSKDGLEFVGKVGTGFTMTVRNELLRTLAARARKTSPFLGRLSSSVAAEAHFVRPDLVGEVQFGEWTDDGRLRQPAWRGLRRDKSPQDVVREY